MKPLLVLALMIATTLRAGTVRNADSCDISVMPAATLLLPHFSVDITSPGQTHETTLFTIVNTSAAAQIAHVTLWTDRGHPVLDFAISLTGYDVQAIDLRDVLVNGTIAAPAGSCMSVPARIPPAILEDVRAALTIGTSASCGTERIGGRHLNAIGYATIDVVSTCAARVITDPAAFDDLLFDNVLTGDFQLLFPNQRNNFATGSPLVHIRAIPEGGRAGERIETNLPYTFYDRYAGGQKRLADRRQPLPSSFAARYIQEARRPFSRI